MRLVKCNDYYNTRTKDTEISKFTMLISTDLVFYIIDKVSDIKLQSTHTYICGSYKFNSD